MIGRIPGVTAVQDTAYVPNVSVFKTPLIPSIDTNTLTVHAASLGLLHATAVTLARGAFLNAATAREPVAVLGALAAQRLGIDRAFPGQRIWLGNQWFYVTGILRPAVLAPDLDTFVLVGYPAAKTYLGAGGHPSTVYVRAQTSQVTAVQRLLAATANPEAPNQVTVSQPS